MAEAKKTTKVTKDVKEDIQPKEDVEITDTPAEKTEVEPADEQKFAKSGKKSKKHIEEVKAEEERQARKEEKKKEDQEAENKPKGAAPKVRPLIERRGKKYQASYKLVDKKKVYNLEDGIKLATETSPAKFDATVEAHVRLGVDPRQADQNIRSTIVLPNGNGKTLRVAVFAPVDDAKKAKDVGADIAEDDAFLKRLEKGETDFDVLISTPQFMPKLGKYARMLGPKGLMPNPKAGTVTNDVEKAVKEAKAGKVEYRVDKQAIIHIGLGKVSFGPEKLTENAKVFFDSLKAQQPSSLKGQYVKSIFISTTMGPSIAIENIYG